jgi:hypothetical protein
MSRGEQRAFRRMTHCTHFPIHSQAWRWNEVNDFIHQDRAAHQIHP